MKFESCATTSSPLGILTKVNCMARLQQAKRIGFYELTGGVQATAIGTDTTVLTKSVYDTLLADATITGLRLPQAKLYSPELTGSEPVMYGSNDNSTPDGQVSVVNQTIPGFTARYSNLTPAQYAELEAVFARGNRSLDFATLGVQFFLGDYQTLLGADNKAIPIFATFIGDPTGMQLNDQTQFMIRFDFLKGWYRSAKIVDLAFNHNLL